MHDSDLQDPVPATGRGPGEPDAFMLRQAEAERRAASKRNWIIVAISLVVLAGSVAAVVFMPGYTGLYVANFGAFALLILPLLTLTDGKVAERPRPDTALEPARAIGSEVVSWGHSRHAHNVRVIAEVFNGPGPDLGLVHGYRDMEVDGGCHVTPGTLLGIRRHPSMKHLVWLEKSADPRQLAILALEERAARGLIDEASLLVVREGELTAATVTALRASEARIGPFCAMTIELRHADGTTGTAKGYFLPEDTALMPTGSQVMVFRAVDRSLPVRTVVALGLPAA